MLSLRGLRQNFMSESVLKLLRKLFSVSLQSLLLRCCLAHHEILFCKLILLCVLACVVALLRPQTMLIRLTATGVRALENVSYFKGLLYIGHLAGCS